jgi:hypothetical protein
MDNILFQHLNYAENKKTISPLKEKYNMQYNSDIPLRRNQYRYIQQYPQYQQYQQYQQQYLPILNNRKLHQNIPTIDTFCTQNGFIKRLPKAPVLLKRKPTIKKSPARKSPTRKSPTRKSPTRKSPTRTSPARTSPTRTSPARTSSAKTSPARTSSAKNQPKVLSIKSNFFPVKTKKEKTTMSFF